MLHNTKTAIGDPVPQILRQWLHKKLAHACDGPNYIETVWGRGYVLRDPHVQTEAA